MTCPASVVLPQVERETPEAELGTAKHVFCEVAEKHGRDKALEFAREQYDDATVEALELLDTDALLTGLAPEVALAYDTESGEARELGRGSGVDYGEIEPPLGPVEIPMRVDLLGVSAERVYVGDLKTGWADPTPAAKNLQLRIGALAACRAYDRDEAIVELIRAPEGARPWRDRAELDAFALDGFAEDLAGLWDRIRGARAMIAADVEPSVRESSSCRYCPAFAACPAKRSLAVRLATGEELQQLGEMQPLTPATAASAWHRLKAARELLRKIESAVMACAKEYGPIDLGNGMLLGETETKSTERLEGEVVRQVLAELYGEEVAAAAVETKTSKEAIKRSLKGKVSKVAPELRKAVEAIREAGGSRKTTPRKKIDEYPAGAAS